MPQKILTTANDVKVLIGASETDVSVALSEGGLIFQESEATLDGFIARTLEAEIVAKNPDYISFSLDPANALWRQNNIVKFVIDDVLFATLRLRSFDYEINCISEEGRGQFSAHCVLSRESFDRPIKPFGSTAWFQGAIRERTTPTTTRLTLPWREAVDKYLGLANLTLSNKNSLPTRLENTYVYGGALQVAGFTAEPVDVNPNPILQAQAIAVAYGYWLTTNASGDVIAVEYPTEPFTNPTIRLNKLQVDSMELERLLTGESDEPPDTVEVVGRDVDSLDDRDEEISEPDPNVDDGEPFEGRPEPCEDAGSGFVETAGGYIINYPPIISSGIGRLNSVKFKSEKFTQRGILFPSLGGAGLIREYLREQEVRYDREGKPLTSVTTLTQPKGLASSSLYPDDTTPQHTDTIEEFWTYNSQGLWVGYRKDTRQRTQIVFNDVEAPGGFSLGERLEENYIEQACEKYAKISATFRPRGIIDPDPNNPYDDSPVLTDNQDPQELDAIPEPPYKPVLTPIRPKVEVQEEEVIADNSDPDNPRKEQVEIAHVSSAEQAKKLSRTITNIFQGRRFARIIERPIDAFTLNNYSIFAIEDVCKYRIIRDGFALAYAEGRLVCNYKGQQVGVLASAVPVRQRPVVVPTAVLTVTPEPDYTITVDEYIEIELEATGGTPPYTWSTSALPTGLTLTGNVISGSVSSATELTTITATVEDSTTATASDTFDLTVVAVPGAVPAYKVISRFDGSLGESGEAFEPQPVVFDGGLGLSGDVQILIRFDGSEGSSGTWLTAIAPIVYDGGYGESGSFEFIDVLFEGGFGSSGESTIQDKDLGAFFDGGYGSSGESTIEDVPSPGTNGWVAHYAGSTGLAIGNVTGNIWTKVVIPDFDSFSTAGRNTIAVGGGFVCVAGISTGDAAVARGAVSADLTNPANWTIYKSGLPTGTGLAQIIYTGTGFVALVGQASATSTLWYSADGTSWILIETSSGVRAIAADSSRSEIYYSEGSNDIWRSNSSDGSAAFSEVATTVGFGTSFIACLRSDNNGTLIATSNTGTTGNNVAYSTDGGSTWTAVASSFPDVAPDLYYDGSSLLLAYDEDSPCSIARCTDLTTGTPPSFTNVASGQECVGIDSDGSIVIAVADLGEYYRSTDGGAAFSAATQLITGETANLLSVRKF